MNKRIDFTSEDILPDGSDFGRVGEKNSTILIITPPTEITENENVSVVCVACEVGDGFIKNVVRSEMIEKAETITVPLWSEATVSEEGKLQVEGYDGEENLLIKSELITYTLSPSVKGEPQRYEENAEINKSIAANTAARHSHINKTVLDKLSESNGSLLYDGKSIAKPEIKSMTFDTQGVTGWASISPFNEYTVMLETFEPLPENIMIVDIRFTYDETEMSLFDLIANGHINGNAIMQIFPFANSEIYNYGDAIGQIINFSQNSLADDIAAYGSRFSHFTIYYIEVTR